MSQPTNPFYDMFQHFILSHVQIVASHNTYLHFMTRLRTAFHDTSQHSIPWDKSGQKLSILFG